MIITRTPLRISIGGGGTDLPSYYEQFGGFVISAAINKYIYITVNRSFREGYFLKYSKIETVQNYDDINHQIFREMLRSQKIELGTEIVSIADVPAGTGMGSSGAFTVGLLNALKAYKRQHISTGKLARAANHMEMTVLGEPCGKQDHYSAAYGGIMCQTYSPNGDVEITPLNISDATLCGLRECLMLFFTGYSRTASDLLQVQKTKTEARDKSILDNLHYIKDLGVQIKESLENGNLADFAALMHEHWQHKRQRTDKMSNSRIDALYQTAMDNGAVGGKLVGAGGGGFLLFYTQDRNRLRRAMTDSGLQEMEFAFDFDGSIIQLRN